MQPTSRPRAGAAAVRLRYVDPPRRQCPIRSPMDPLMQILELALKVCLVVRPRQSIHARRGILLEFEERLFEQVDADVVEERGEPLLLPFLCDLPYAFQRLCHACPALRPARALLVRIPLGPRPSLHRLRCVCSVTDRSAAGRSALFAGFTATMAGSDFSCPCIIGYGSSPSRCGPPYSATHSTPTARREISQVPMRSFCT